MTGKEKVREWRPAEELVQKNETRTVFNIILFGWKTTQQRERGKDLKGRLPEGLVSGCSVVSI